MKIRIYECTYYLLDGESRYIGFIEWLLGLCASKLARVGGELLPNLAAPTLHSAPALASAPWPNDASALGNVLFPTQPHFGCDALALPHHGSPPVVREDERPLPVAMTQVCLIAIERGR